MPSMIFTRLATTNDGPFFADLLDCLAPTLPLDDFNIRFVFDSKNALCPTRMERRDHGCRQFIQITDNNNIATFSS